MLKTILPTSLQCTQYVPVCILCGTNLLDDARAYDGYNVYDNILGISFSREREIAPNMQPEDFDREAVSRIQTKFRW